MYVGKVTHLGQVVTDRRRLDSYTRDLALNQSTLYAGYAGRFTHFRKTFGYANMPLDGLWLRAPYLHNGSVPTLRDLLKPAAARPKAFWRGDDVYDPVRSEEHTSELQSLMRTSYSVFCLKKKTEEKKSKLETIKHK